MKALALFLALSLVTDSMAFLSMMHPSAEENLRGRLEGLNSRLDARPDLARLRPRVRSALGMVRSNPQRARQVIDEVERALDAGTPTHSVAFFLPWGGPISPDEAAVRNRGRVKRDLRVQAPAWEQRPGFAWIDGAPVWNEPRGYRGGVYVGVEQPSPGARRRAAYQPPPPPREQPRRDDAVVRLGRRIETGVRRSVETVGRIADRIVEVLGEIVDVASKAVHRVTGLIMYPLEGAARLISSGFRTRKRPNHNGVDYAAACGTKIIAAGKGVIVKIKSGCPPMSEGDLGCGGGFGNHIYLRHDNGHTTIYGHMSRLGKTAENRQLRMGDQVQAGFVIGFVGNTGNVRASEGGTGCHLHYEMHGPGGAMNPVHP